MDSGADKGVTLALGTEKSGFFRGERDKRPHTDLLGSRVLCWEVLGDSDLSYILQGVVISGKHQWTAVTAEAPAALMDCCADTVLIVACCAVPLAPSSNRSLRRRIHSSNQWWVITKFISHAGGLEIY